MEEEGEGEGDEGEGEGAFAAGECVVSGMSADLAAGRLPIVQCIAATPLAPALAYPPPGHALIYDVCVHMPEHSPGRCGCWQDRRPKTGNVPSLFGSLQVLRKNGIHLQKRVQALSVCVNTNVCRARACAREREGGRKRARERERE